MKVSELFNENADVRDLFDISENTDEIGKCAADSKYLETTIKMERIVGKRKGDLKVKVITMTPDLYMKLAGTMIGGTSQSKVDDLLKAVTANPDRKLPVPCLDYKGIHEANYQDGRHRSAVAKLLGLKKIPVIIAYRNLEDVPHEVASKL